MTSFALTTGQRTQQVVAAALHGDLPPSRRERALTLCQLVRGNLSEHPVSARDRETFLTVVTAAGVYLNRFHPPAPWGLIDTEYSLGGCRFDIAYESRHGVLIDELKLGVGRAGESKVRGQIERYLTVGAETWGDRFLGVRMCSVHEPIRSRLYLPSGRFELLTGVPHASGIRVR